MRWALLLVVAGCFDPKFNNPACGPEGECPPGLTCIAGTCRMPTDAGDDSLDAPPDMMIDGPPGSVTRIFQQGSNLYDKARDTYLSQGDGTPNNTEPVVRWKQDERWGLLAFDEIITPTAVPQGATILSATLRVVIASTNMTGTMYESAVPWTVAVTYDTYGPTAGVQPTDLGAMLATTPPTSGPHTIDVKASLDRWVADPSTNHGWIFAPAVSGGNGDGSFRSSDEQQANRPLLTVTFFP